VTVCELQALCNFMAFVGSGSATLLDECFKFESAVVSGPHGSVRQVYRPACSLSALARLRSRPLAFNRHPVLTPNIVAARRAFARRTFVRWPHRFVLC